MIVVERKHEILAEASMRVLVTVSVLSVMTRLAGKTSIWTMVRTITVQDDHPTIARCADSRNRTDEGGLVTPLKRLASAETKLRIR